jgi:hypothetical protein
MRRSGRRARRAPTAHWVPRDGCADRAGRPSSRAGRDEAVGDRAMQPLDLALLVRRVRGRRVDVDAKRRRGLLDRGGGELEPVIPTQPPGKATERPARRVDQDRVTQGGQHIGRAGLQRDRPAHDRARAIVEEQRHPRLPAAPSPGRHDLHRELLVVGLPDSVAMRRLVAQIEPVLATPGLAAGRRRALGRRQLARERRLQRPQRRRLKAAVACRAPHRGDVAAPPQVGVAQLRREHESPRG